MKIEVYPEAIFKKKFNKPAKGFQLNVPAILIFK